VRFALPEDALDVRDGLRAVLRDHCSTELLREASSPQGYEGVRRLWNLLGGMGVLGLVVPESRGGLGCDELFLVAALEELGYFAAPGPLGEVISIVAPVLADTPEQEELLIRLLAGDVLVAFDLGEGPVSYAQVADAFITLHDGELRLAPQGQVSVDALATIDPTRQSGRIHVTGTQQALSSDGLQRALDRATLAAASELVGLSARMLDMTTAYVLTREQFGVPIGSFQAVKHALADSLIAIEFARPAVWRAAASMSTGDPRANCHVSMAKAMASDAARQVARTSIQCHGAMGYTVEYELHFIVKRAWARCADMGDSEVHTSRVAQWLGI
jgi:alkylation response protein AidB-like acyl-CoA dehydrogenase